MSARSSEAPSPRTPRPRLDADTIVDAALRVVRAEGLPAVSMRRLAEELGSAPMSLYRHVDDRQALLVGMLDRVARGLHHPERQPSPRAELAAVVTAVHDGLLRDPWVIELLVTEGLAGPAVLPLVERAFEALAAAGASPDQAVRIYESVFEFVYGHVLVTRHDRPDAFSRRMVAASDPDRYPHLHAVLAAVRPPRPDVFADTLHSLLDALLPGA